mmetsp:Transcript_110947/g.312795  ORF Transcript_110947/g.312795 Transcript_110947/m.312795 type:complete len:277 (-) Transcript_110947:58-888(-)
MRGVVPLAALLLIREPGLHVLDAAATQGHRVTIEARQRLLGRHQCRVPHHDCASFPLSMLLWQNPRAREPGQAERVVEDLQRLLGEVGGDFRDVQRVRRRVLRRGLLRRRLRPRASPVRLRAEVSPRVRSTSTMVHARTPGLVVLLRVRLHATAGHFCGQLPLGRRRVCVPRADVLLLSRFGLHGRPVEGLQGERGAGVVGVAEDRTPSLAPQFSWENLHAAEGICQAYAPVEVADVLFAPMPRQVADIQCRGIGSGSLPLHGRDAGARPSEAEPD